jgi:hypothetical protein
MEAKCSQIRLARGTVVVVAVAAVVVISRKVEKWVRDSHSLEDAFSISSVLGHGKSKSSGNIPGSSRNSRLALQAKLPPPLLVKCLLIKG